MKQCLLTAAGIFLGMCLALMLLMSAGAVLQEPTQETVLSVTALENAFQPSSGGVSFPFDLPNSTLAVQSLAWYEGDMMETVSDTHLVDAAALEVKNYGDRDVEMALITLEFGSEQMHFFGTNIPPNSTTLLVEMEGKTRVLTECTDCTGWVLYSADTQLLDTAIQVTEVDMGTLRVENISQKAQENVMLYHKNYLFDDALYLGGITYQTYIGTLEPGAIVEITPYRYASGYSKIIKAVNLP